MDESSGDVALSRVQTEFGGKDHHQANGAPLDDRGPGLKEIDAFALEIAADDKTGLELLGKAAGEVLDFEHPFGGKDAHPRLPVNDSPGLERGFKSFELKLHGLEPFVLVDATHGLSVGGAIRVGGRGLTTPDGGESLIGAGGGRWVSKHIHTAICVMRPYRVVIGPILPPVCTRG